jgi:hypothetical protein
MDERRQTFRNRSLLGAVISFKRSPPVDGVVRNVSPEGAKIVFPNAANIPDQFDLQIAWQDRVYRAHMIWRSASEVGVKFDTSAARLSVIPSELVGYPMGREAAKARLH